MWRLLRCREAARLARSARGVAASPASSLRPLSATASAQPQPGASAVEVFDGAVKTQHTDPLHEEVAERLLERLEDCKRAFPRVLVLGGALAAVAGRLREGRAGCTHATFADSSPAQLELARAALCPDRGPQDTQFTRLASDEVLPFPVSSFDLVVCCLGIHWRNDLPGVLVQARRTLRPDGLFLGALLGGSTLSELRIACSLAEQEREGGLSARCSPLAQVRDAGSLLGRAGLSLPAVDVDTLTVRYPTPLDAVTHLRVLAEGNAVAARRKSLRRDTALASAALCSTLFAEEGAEQPPGVPSTFQVVYMTGWAPHENQPAAKRRGSATVSFADLANGLQLPG